MRKHRRVRGAAAARGPAAAPSLAGPAGAAAAVAASAVPTAAAAAAAAAHTAARACAFREPVAAVPSTRGPGARGAATRDASAATAAATRVAAAIAPAGGQLVCLAGAQGRTPGLPYCQLPLRLCFGELQRLLSPRQVWVGGRSGSRAPLRLQDLTVAPDPAYAIPRAALAAVV